MNASEISVGSIDTIGANNLQFVLTEIVDISIAARTKAGSAEQLGADAQFLADQANTVALSAKEQATQVGGNMEYLTALAEYCQYHIGQIAQIAGVDYDLPPFAYMARSAVAPSSEDA